jgi:transposase InsO family protein
MTSHHRRPQPSETKLWQGRKSFWFIQNNRHLGCTHCRTICQYNDELPGWCSTDMPSGPIKGALQSHLFAWLRYYSCYTAVLLSAQIWTGHAKNLRRRPEVHSRPISSLQTRVSFSIRSPDSLTRLIAVFSPVPFKLYTTVCPFRRVPQ